MTVVWMWVWSSIKAKAIFLVLAGVIHKLGRERRFSLRGAMIMQNEIGLKNFTLAQFDF